MGWRWARHFRTNKIRGFIYYNEILGKYIQFGMIFKNKPGFEFHINIPRKFSYFIFKFGFIIPEISIYVGRAADWSKSKPMSPEMLKDMDDIFIKHGYRTSNNSEGKEMTQISGL